MQWALTPKTLIHQGSEIWRKQVLLLLEKKNDCLCQSGRWGLKNPQHGPLYFKYFLQFKGKHGLDLLSLLLRGYTIAIISSTGMCQACTCGPVWASDPALTGSVPHNMANGHQRVSAPCWTLTYAAWLTATCLNHRAVCCVDFLIKTVDDFLLAGLSFSGCSSWISRSDTIYKNSWLQPFHWYMLLHWT